MGEDFPRRGKKGQCVMADKFCRKNKDGTFDILGTLADPYLYIEDSADTLSIKYPVRLRIDLAKPIIWAQEGRYGFISREQILNMIRRQKDLAKQQKGYARNGPLNLVFYWDDTLQLDPFTVELMRGQQ